MTGRSAQALRVARRRAAQRAAEHRSWRTSELTPIGGNAAIVRRERATAGSSSLLAATRRSELELADRIIGELHAAPVTDSKGRDHGS